MYMVTKNDDGLWTKQHVRTGAIVRVSTEVLLEDVGVGFYVEDREMDQKSQRQKNRDLVVEVAAIKAQKKRTAMEAGLALWKQNMEARRVQFGVDPVEWAKFMNEVLTPAVYEDPETGVRVSVCPTGGDSIQVFAAHREVVTVMAEQLRVSNDIAREENAAKRAKLAAEVAQRKAEGKPSKKDLTNSQKSLPLTFGTDLPDALELNALQTVQAEAVKEAAKVERLRNAEAHENLHLANARDKLTAIPPKKLVKTEIVVLVRRVWKHLHKQGQTKLNSTSASAVVQAAYKELMTEVGSAGIPWHLLAIPDTAAAAAAAAVAPATLSGAFDSSPSPTPAAAPAHAPAPAPAPAPAHAPVHAPPHAAPAPTPVHAPVHAPAHAPAPAPTAAAGATNREPSSRPSTTQSSNAGNDYSHQYLHKRTAL
jgi:hypothetical protein